ncbi:MAG: hypothetical protein ABFD54_05270 [Armatimonadota bacterium]
MVLVIAGGTSIRDIADPDLPNLARLLKTGSAALANVRTGRPTKDIEPVEAPGMEPGCVTIGAGALAIGGVETRRAAGHASEFEGVPAGSVYTCRTGHLADKAEVLHMEISKMQRANVQASYRAVPGLLGTTLHGAGIRTAIIGNSDIPGLPHREAVAIVMDANGTVDFGDVDSKELSVPDPQSAYGLRANIPAIMSRFDRVYDQSMFIVIDFGDTLRADNYAQSCSDDQAFIIRHRAARGLDDLIGRLSGKLDFNKDVLIVLSPNPRSFSEIDAERMAPIITCGPGFGEGLLTSPSTRRAGVVTIADVTPTVLSLFNVKQPLEMIGRPMARVPGYDVAGRLLDLNLRASTQGQRQVAMRGASVVQSVMVALVTLIVLLAVPRSIKTLAAWGALIPAALPMIMLYLPLIYSGGLVGAVLLLITLTLLVLTVCRLAFGSPQRAFVWLCVLTVASLVVDLLRGAPLISSSIAGYGIIEGARYYGIGNELMGTMIGAALAGMGVLLSGGRIRGLAGTVIVLMLSIVVFFSIGAPALGANFGGALSAAPAMAAMVLAMHGWRPNAKSILVIVLLTALVVGGLMGADVLRGGAGQSHVGRAAEMAVGGDAGGLLVVAERKIALNFMLVSTSLWSRLLGLSVLGSVVLCYWSRRRVGGKLLSREETAAAAAICIGSVAAFVFNDSGVVAAATCAVFLWTLLALKVLVATIKEPES